MVKMPFLAILGTRANIGNDSIKINTISSCCFGFVVLGM